VRQGVEVSRFAGEHARTWGEIHIGTLESARYADASFDAVVLHHVIEHVEDPSALLQEIFRVLAPGGRLVLGTPDFDSAAARRFGERFRLLSDPTHISLFSCESMHRFVTAHGFVIERVSFPYFETRHFTSENLLRMLNADAISPPFYGSFMTFYLRKPRLAHLVGAYARLGAVGMDAATEVEVAGAAALARLRAAERVSVYGDRALAPVVRQLLRDALGETRVSNDDEGDLALGVPSHEDQIPDGPSLVIAPSHVRAATEPSIALRLPSGPPEAARAGQLLVVEALLAELAQAPA
jgi:hypothetical protein